MIKVFVTDLDGTLLLNNPKDNYYSLNTRSKQAMDLLNERGIKKIIASGRTLADTLMIHQKLLNDKDTTICTLNGALIYENGINNIYSSLSDEDCFKIKDYILDCPYEMISYSVVSFSSKRIFIPFIEEIKPYYLEHYGKENVLFGFENVNKFLGNIAKMMCYTKNGEDAKNIVNYLKPLIGDKYNVFTSQAEIVEISPIDGNKSTIIKFLLDKGYKLEEIAVFGDGENDIPMLERAKYSYCMKSGSLKAQAVSYKCVDDVLDGVIDCLKIK